jgi:hypothetical protein
VTAIENDRYLRTPKLFWTNGLNPRCRGDAQEEEALARSLLWLWPLDLAGRPDNCAGGER